MNALKNIKIELTSKCFQSCSKCPRTLLKGQYSELDLPLQHIQTIIDTKPKLITLMGNLGDPIYHSQFLEIVQLINTADIPMHVFTVGSGYGETWWNDIYTVCKHKDNKWFFDVDGLEHTAGTYRRGLVFEQSFAAMRIGAELGKNINWSFPVLKHNQHEVATAKHLANKYGINFRINYSERWDINDPWKPTISKKDIDTAL